MKIKLYEDKIPYNTATNDEPDVTAYPTESWYKLPAVIVLPGGGYRGLADHEAEPIAKFYNSKGFHSFVLRYRLIPNLYPSALCDVQRLIKYLRANADELRIDENKIFVIGFSAGGHLAALSAVSEDVCLLGDGLDSYSHKPSGVMLGYPVILGEHGCVKDVCGFNDNLYDKLSIEKQVTPDTPKMFIWHTSDDEVVDVQNSLKLATALKENNVKFEMHIFPSGQHGLGLAQLYKDISVWSELSFNWLLNNF